MHQQKVSTYLNVATTASVIPHGEDDDASLTVDLLYAGVSAGAPTDDAEVRTIPTLLDVDGALKGPSVANVAISEAMVPKVAGGGRL